MATFVKPAGPLEAPKPLQEVATPGCRTIAEVSSFLGMPSQQTLKALFYTTAADEVVMALIRGDLEANLVKLAHALGGTELRPASEEDLRAAGVVPGYASPLGLTDLRVIADESIKMGSNFVAGANKEGYHAVNANYPRDFSVAMITDIGLARAGDRCPQCSAPLEAPRAIEVGHLFKLGTRYSEAAGATYLDADSQARPIVMGSYGIGTGRLLAVIVEENHDQRGIVWPAAVAPYPWHLLSLGTDPEVVGAADQLYNHLVDTGHQVLYDDRDERAGVKFNDADLIGSPWRIVVSRRTLAEESVEVKGRSESDANTVPVDQLDATLAGLLGP
jgi:prolyl-tRNA synthetase